MKQEKIYFLTEGTHIKIGYTTQPITSRIKQLNTGSVQEIYLLGWMWGTKELEKQLHQRFANSRVRFNGEWFDPTEELIAFINENNQKPNTTVEIVDNNVMSLFSLKKI